MDPLTVTLAAVTLATAIKDIIELVQKIRASASQILRNNEDSLRLSEDIVRTMGRIQEFCDNNPDTLENAAELKTALIDMKREMQCVHDRICEMLPSRVKNKLFIRMWLKTQAWRQQRQVKEEIRELRDRINQYHMEFVALSVMRIEGQVRQPSSVTKCLVRMSSHGSDQCSSNITTQGTLHLQVNERRLAAFTRPGPTVHLNSSPELTGDLLSDMYIRFQLQRIGKLMVDLPTIHFSSIEDPSERYTSPFAVSGLLMFWEPSAVRDVVVVDIHKIQQIIQAGFTTLTAQEAAWEMGELSLDLLDLSMQADAAIICHWTVQLFRVLVKGNSIIYTPYLTQALFYFSDSCLDAADPDTAQLAISESYTLIQTLRENNPSNREFMILHCRILIALGKVASYKGDEARQLQYVEEAVMMFETLLQPCIVGDSLITRHLETSWNKERMYLALRDYSRSLSDLSYILHASDRFSDSVIVAKKAVAVIRIIIAAYPECYMQAELADILHQLSSSDYWLIIGLQDAQIYAKESTTLYRKLYNRLGEPQKFAMCLFYGLSQLAEIQDHMKRLVEALLARQEMTDLARRITDNRELLAESLEFLSSNLHLLRRYDEAVTSWLESVKIYRTIYKKASIHEANCHCNIALSLRCAGRPQDALPEVEEAIVQYWALAFDNPNQFLPNLACGLYHLSHILNNVGHYARAFSEGHESLKIFESIISSRPDMVNHYALSLATNMRISHNLRHPTESVQRGEDIIRQFRRLEVQYPSELGLQPAVAMQIYSSLLDSLDMVPKGIYWCNQSLELYKDDKAKDAESFEGQMNCLVELNLYLWAQGYFSRALEPLEKAIRIGEERLSKHPSLLLTLINIKRRYVIVLCNLGRFPEALENINATVAFYHETACSHVETLIHSLQIASQFHRMNRNPEASIKAAREAVGLSRSRSTARYLACSLQELAEGLADNGMGNEAQETTEEMQTIDSSWKHNVEAVRHQSVLLFSGGELSDDADLLRVKDYYKKKTDKRPGYASRFAVILWTLGVFYCAQNRHEEGQVVAAELKQLMLRLQAYPEPAGDTKRMLEYEQNRPLWGAFLEKLDLGCGHQKAH